MHEKEHTIYMYLQKLKYCNKVEEQQLQLEKAFFSSLTDSHLFNLENLLLLLLLLYYIIVYTCLFIFKNYFVILLLFVSGMDFCM